jgi:acetylornithine/succinyldiaminopimelate/putrescine aminotransferase
MLNQRQLFLHHVAQTSDAPMMLEIVKAEGIYLFDANGNAYMDFISGISVSNVGHRHPRVLKAIHDQLDCYMHLMVYGEYVQHPQVKLATKLASLLPGLDSVYFVNSGSEAVEGALKLARRATGRKKIVSFKNAYHGSTTGALSLMSDEYFTAPFQPLLPDVVHISTGNYNELNTIDSDTAAVFVEYIRGEAGAEEVDPEFLVAIRQRCNETGALFIADEIQTGFGRTGRLFAFTRHSFTPDIIVMAKGMGGGMPLGAFVASRSLMNCLTHDPVLGHITTFGGHPVSCAASLATLETLLEIDLENHVAALESLIRTKLKHPLILGITGKGLLLGVDLGDVPTAQRVIANCIRLQVITDWFLFAPYKMRIAPPVTITLKEMALACDKIIAALELSL